jgi:hypothetical protein
VGTVGSGVFVAVGVWVGVGTTKLMSADVVKPFFRAITE